MLAATISHVCFGTVATLPQGKSNLSPYHRSVWVYSDLCHHQKWCKSNQMITILASMCKSTCTSPDAGFGLHPDLYNLKLISGSSDLLVSCQLVYFFPPAKYFLVPNMLCCCVSVPCLVCWINGKTQKLRNLDATIPIFVTCSLLTWHRPPFDQVLLCFWSLCICTVRTGYRGVGGD